MGSAADPAAFAPLAAFLRAVRSSAAQRASATPLGTALRHRELPRISNVNGLIVDDAHGPEVAADVVAEGLRLARVCEDVRISVPEGPLAAAIERALPEEGWTAERHVLMLLREPAAVAPGGAHAVEVERAAARELERAVETSSSYGEDGALIEQLLAYNDAVHDQMGGRCFAAEDASVCTLLSDGRRAQVEQVVTLPEARGRGLARATIAAAIAAAAEAGHAATFIVADANDWPRELYRRMGFEPVGVMAHFSRYT